jgi:hypothetical protein
MMTFDPELIPFSGVYKVNKATSTFKDGMFKQRLEILRMPGQILDKNIKPSDPNDSKLTLPSTLNQVIPDTTRASAPSQRLDSSTAMEQLERGLPSPGLPGELSNFTAATGGLGGLSPGMLIQSPGRILKNGQLTAASSIIGQPLPTDISSNIRLNSSGLASVNQTGLGTAALLTVATGLVTKTIPSSKAVGALATAVGAGALAMALSKPNKGSGIGEGATQFLPTAVSDPTGNDIKFGSTIDPTKIASDTVNNIGGAFNELGSSAVNIASNLGKGVSGLVKDVGSKVSSLLGSSSDPKALGANVGLDVAQLSGLGAGLQSKALSQIANFGSNTPKNVNLGQAVDNGVVLDYISPSKVANIPPVAPYTKAPIAGVDTAYVNEVAAKGGATGLANLYGVTSVKELSGNILPSGVLNSALQNIPTSQINPFLNVPGQFNAVDLNSVKDKFASAQSLTSGITGQLPVVDQGLLGTVSAKFGSSSAGQSPLAKLINGTTTLET